MPKPERCGKCGAEPEVRKRCLHCGDAEWVLRHGAHYMGGAREVFDAVVQVSIVPLVARRKRSPSARLAGVRAGKRAYSNRPVTTPEMAKKAAEGLACGLSPHRALKEAGFPESTCKQSGKGVNRMIRAELKTMGRKYIEMGRDLTPEDQELIVRGRLLENVIIGTDRGVMAARQLGADKRISMWQADSQVGMVMLQPPPIPKIDHEVPWIKSKYSRHK